MVIKRQRTILTMIEVVVYGITFDLDEDFAKIESLQICLSVNLQEAILMGS